MEKLQIQQTYKENKLNKIILKINSINELLL